MEDRRPPWFLRSPRAANLLAAASAMLLLFAAAEIVARAVYHPDNLGTVIRFDPHLGWALDAGSETHSVDERRSLDYVIRINRLGMREREFDAKKAPGVRRVAFVGDSFAFGVGVEQDRRCSDYLGRALGDRFEVINAAVCGWGIDQELIHYERTLRPLEPDVVVLTVCMSNDVLNDMLDHLYLGDTAKPRFVLADSLELRGGEIARPDIAGHHRVRDALKRSRFLVFVKRRLDVLAHRPTGVAPVDHDHPGFRAADRHTHSHWSVFEREYDEEMESAWRVSEAIIERFARDCRQDGTDLIVLAFPLQIEVDDAWRARALEKAGIDGATLDIERPFRRLEECCRRLGIPCLHPVDEFRRASSHRSLYLEKDVHPNAYGHAVAAAAVMDEFRHHYGIDVNVAGADRATFGEVGY